MSSTPSASAESAASLQEMNLGAIILISLIATIGGFLFGFDSGVINGTVDGLRQAFHSTNVGTGFNVASMLLGCAAGAFFAGRLADIFGRRSILIVAAVFFIVSAWGSGVANGSLEFVIYRIIGGLAVGAASVLAPAYISEVAPARLRGRLSSIQQVAIIVGLTAAFISNYLLALFAGSATADFWLGFKAWRWMYWMEIAPAAIFFLALLTIPESPRFLALKGRKDAAKAVLARLFGERAAAQKVSEIEASLAADHHRPRFSDLINPATKRIRTIVWVGIGLASFQQLVGINVVFYYGAVLWQSVGFSESDALLTNVIMGGVSILAVAVTLMVIDLHGRKPILLIGSLGMSATLALMAVAFLNAQVGAGGAVTLPPLFGKLALLSAVAYVALFNFSWGPVMWVMLGEMFPNQIRGSGLAVSGLFQWGTNFLVTMTFPILLTTITLAGAYAIYAAFAVISVFFVRAMVRETKGVELEHMDG
ncbi:MAG: sugar porter family MFS transporter [Alphaproteobacteria bacterium]|nr:sugar porter family MFS transporter [Alphaproteobacteria bacterium]